jgi:RNA polymerase sigma factor (sigma-70 family)
MDDATLLSASQTGDVNAFGQLIERYHNLVCAIAYSRVGDRVASEDIAQETFIAAWAGLGSLRDASKLRPWLTSIARNLAMKSVRDKKPEEDISAHAGELAGDAGPLDAMLTKELETTVWSALQQLPETYREPLVLFYREEQSIRDVALGLGLSEETAKQRLSRGRQQLRDNVGDLVEQTLQKGRPRKAAAAAVLAAVIARGAKPALASTAKTKYWKVGAGIVALGAAATVAVVLARSQATTSPSRDSRELLTELRRARDARPASATEATCQLGGSLTRAGLVAVVDTGMQASALEPRFVEVRAGERWSMTVAAGVYTVAVNAPGARARSRLVTCAAGGVEDVTFALVDGSATLRGSISDTGGGPIASATVWLLDQNQPDEPYLSRSRGDGSYEITVEPGLYVALVVHPDYTIETRPITLGPAGVRENLTLLPGGSIEGTVIDDAGTPVAGAKVTTLPPPLQATSDSPLRWKLAATYGALLPALSDAQGRFVLRGLPPGSVRLVARTATHATTSPTSLELTLAENKTGAAITVVHGHSISGFVVARGQSRGLAGVRVVAVREDAMIAMPSFVVTDATGYFELAGLAPAPYRIAAIGDDFAPYVADASITLDDRDSRDMLIALDRGVVVRGSVAPGARATVKLTASPVTSPAQLMRSVMTRAVVDDQGNFTFAAVAPGSYVVSATTFDRRGERSVAVGASAPAPLRIALEPRPAIAGEVVDDQGTKLAGVLVHAERRRALDQFGALHSTVRTDERGVFQIVGVEPGDYHVQVFDDRGQRAWADDKKRPFRRRYVTVPESGAVRETLAITRGVATLNGVVVTPDQRPVADAWIELRARDTELAPPLFPSPPILTDAKGEFSVDRLTGTELVVEASGPDGTQRAAVVATPGTRVKLELHPLSTVIGSVSHGGQPVDSFELSLRDPRTGERQHVRSAGGRFSLTAMVGEHELEVTSSRGYAKRTITLDASQPKLDIALTAWGSLRGRVLGGDGKPWVNARLLVRESVEPTLEQTDRDGNFSIDRVIAGTNELLIIHEAGPDQSTEFHFELAVGEQLDAGTIDASARRITTASASADLGLSFYVSVKPPTAAQIVAVANDARAASRGGSDPNAVLWIVAVTPNSPAARAGLRAGDRVVGVGLWKINGGKSAVDQMMSLSTPWRSKGRPVRWAIVRDGRELTFEVLVP